MTTTKANKTNKAMKNNQNYYIFLTTKHKVEQEGGDPSFF